MSNIFTEYQEQRESLCLIIKKAQEYEWINDEDANNLVNNNFPLLTGRVNVKYPPREYKFL